MGILAIHTPQKTTKRTDGAPVPTVETAQTVMYENAAIIPAARIRADIDGGLDVVTAIARIKVAIAAVDEEISRRQMAIGREYGNPDAAAVG
jgi:hypothetical protein